MAKFDVMVVRETSYTVEAETAEEAVDKVLEGDADENGSTTLSHRVYDDAGRLAPTKAGRL